MLNRSLTEPTADYEWNGKYWDLKTLEETKGIDKLVHHGLHQISHSPVDIVVDCSNKNINIEQAIYLAQERLDRSGRDKKIRVIVKVGNEIRSILK